MHLLGTMNVQKHVNLLEDVEISYRIIKKLALQGINKDRRQDRRIHHLGTMIEHNASISPFRPDKNPLNIWLLSLLAFIPTSNDSSVVIGVYLNGSNWKHDTMGGKANFYPIHGTKPKPLFHCPCCFSTGVCCS